MGFFLVKDLQTPLPQKEPMVRFFYYTFQTILRRKKNVCEEKKYILNFSKKNVILLHFFFQNIFFQISKIFFEHTFQTILRRIFFIRIFFFKCYKILSTFFLWQGVPPGLCHQTPHAFGLRTLVGTGQRSTAFQQKSLPDFSKKLLTFFSKKKFPSHFYFSS